MSGINLCNAMHFISSSNWLHEENKKGYYDEWWYHNTVKHRLWINISYIHHWHIQIILKKQCNRSFIMLITINKYLLYIFKMAVKFCSIFSLFFHFLSETGSPFKHGLCHCDRWGRGTHGEQWSHCHKVFERANTSRRGGSTLLCSINNQWIRSCESAVKYWLLNRVEYDRLL